MKIKSLLFTAFAVCSLAASAELASTTNLSHAVINEGGSVKAGEVAYVAVTVTNPDVQYASVEAHYTLPAGWTAVEFSQADAGIGTKTKKAYAQIIPGSRADENENHDAFSVTGAVPSEDPTAFGWVLMSLANERFETGDDALLVFAIQVPEDAPAGDNAIQVTGQAFSTAIPDDPADGELDDTTFNISVTTAVNDVNATKTVAGVKYFNLAGVESNVPFDGVNVVVTTYTDGTKAASKVIK